MKLEIVEETDELDRAERELRSLENERDALPGRMAAAAKAADVEALRELRRRAVDISTDIFAAKAWALRLEVTAEETKIAALRRQIAEGEAALSESAEDLRRRQDEVNVAVAEHHAMEFRVGRLISNAELSKANVRELKDELDLLIRRAGSDEEAA